MCVCVCVGGGLIKQGPLTVSRGGGGLIKQGSLTVSILFHAK